MKKENAAGAGGKRLDDIEAMKKIAHNTTFVKLEETKENTKNSVATILKAVEEYAKNTITRDEFEAIVGKNGSVITQNAKNIKEIGKVLKPTAEELEKLGAVMDEHINKMHPALEEALEHRFEEMMTSLNETKSLLKENKELERQRLALEQRTEKLYRAILDILLESKLKRGIAERILKLLGR